VETPRNDLTQPTIYFKMHSGSELEAELIGDLESMALTARDTANGH
jgi:hypothetical protein